MAHVESILDSPSASTEGSHVGRASCPVDHGERMRGFCYLLGVFCGGGGKLPGGGFLVVSPDGKWQS